MFKLCVVFVFLLSDRTESDVQPSDL